MMVASVPTKNENEKLGGFSLNWINIRKLVRIEFSYYTHVDEKCKINLSRKPITKSLQKSYTEAGFTVQSLENRLR